MIDRKHLEWLPPVIFLGLCIGVLSYLWLTGQYLPVPSGNIDAFYINTILIAIIAIYALIVVLQLRATYKKILKENRNVQP
jgi:TRAP-type C4-dicarboxylate transport system permease small subunit